MAHGFDLSKRIEDCDILITLYGWEKRMCSYAAHSLLIINYLQTRILDSCRSVIGLCSRITTGF